MQFVDVHYRPLGGRILAVSVVAIAAMGIVAIAVHNPVDALRYCWPLLLVAALAVILFWAPQLSVQAHGVTVANPFRTVFVSWPSIRSIDTRWSLTLTTATRKVGVWAAPAPSRHRAAGLSRSDFIGIGPSAQGQHQSLRPSDAISTPSGNLAQVVRGRWEALRESGALDAGTDPSADWTKINVPAIATIVALVAASVVGAVV
ncbi:PH domain-containing protein [Microbacterium sp.]|uniref:PH domain-containing protein n=1 Tax=Microbacterium sp. TaxID=51671 RepID=UPI00263022C0|nr:PH domain-containing protein [Microbacterium sp.]